MHITFPPLLAEATSSYNPWNIAMVTVALTVLFLLLLQLQRANRPPDFSNTEEDADPSPEPPPSGGHDPSSENLNALFGQELTTAWGAYTADFFGLAIPDEAEATRAYEILLGTATRESRERHRWYTSMAVVRGTFAQTGNSTRLVGLLVPNRWRDAHGLWIGNAFNQIGEQPDGKIHTMEDKSCGEFGPGSLISIHQYKILGFREESSPMEIDPNSNSLLPPYTVIRGGSREPYCSEQCYRETGIALATFQITPESLDRFINGKVCARCQKVIPNA